MMREADARDLRIKLLKISDEIQSLSVEFRSKELRHEHAVELNLLQIKVSELIGKIRNEK